MFTFGSVSWTWTMESAAELSLITAPTTPASLTDCSDSCASLVRKRPSAKGAALRGDGEQQVDGGRLLQRIVKGAEVEGHAVGRVLGRERREKARADGVVGVRGAVGRSAGRRRGAGVGADGRAGELGGGEDRQRQVVRDRLVVHVGMRQLVRQPVGDGVAGGDLRSADAGPEDAVDRVKGLGRADPRPGAPTRRCRRFA